MGRKSTLVIRQSEEELLYLLKNQRCHKNHQKLNCLLHLKRGTFSKLDDLAISQSISSSTLDKWIKRYKEESLESFLAPIKGKRSSKLITPDIHQGLQERLSSEDNPFLGYWDAQVWVAQTYGVEIEYQWLWKYMTTKLNAKFKIPRRSNVKKDKDAEKAFLKTAGYAKPS